MRPAGGGDRRASGRRPGVMGDELKRGLHLHPDRETGYATSASSRSANPWSSATALSNASATASGPKPSFSARTKVTAVITMKTSRGDRKSVVEERRVSLRVDLGGRHIKKKKTS